MVSATSKKELRQLIDQDSGIEELSISFRDIPKEIGLLQKLRVLRLETRVGRIPKAIGKLVQLEELEIRDCKKLKKFPDCLRQLKKLRVLSLGWIRHWQAASCWKGLEDLQRLEQLQLAAGEPDYSDTFIQSNPEAFPPQILELKNLKELDLADFGRDNYYEVPKELVALQQLEFLDLSTVHQFPEMIWELPNLKVLGLPALLLFDRGNCGQLLDLHQLEKLSLRGQRLGYISEMAKFIKYAAKQKFGIPYRRLIKGLFENPLTIEKLSNKKLLSVLDSGSVSLERKATTELEKRIANLVIGENRPISKSSQVLFKGKFNENVSKLKLQLKNQEIKLSSKIGKTNTHLVLGRQSFMDYESLLNQKITILTEHLFRQQLDQLGNSYLQKDSTENQESIERLRELLLSHNEENVNLAFQLLDGGGDPKGLTTEMFLVYKTTTYKASIKKRAASYLERFGSAETISWYKKRMVLCNRDVEKDRLRKNIQSYCNYIPELKPLTIALYLHRHYQTGTTYALTRLSSEDKIAYLQERIENGRLQLKYYDSPIPKEITHFKDELTELDLFMRNNGKFPSIILRLKKLEVFKLTGRWGLDLPNHILHKLPNLRELHLAKNGVWNIPKAKDLKVANCLLFWVKI